MGTQSIFLDLSLTTLTKNFAVTDTSVGGGGYIGIKNKGDAKLCVPFVGCTSKLAEGKQSFTTANNKVETSTNSYTDSSETSVTSQGLTLSTPSGASGKEGDMVLLIGMIAKFITAVSVSFDEGTCTIQERDSTVWGSETESLLFYSRNDCEVEYDKLEKTITDNKPLMDDPDVSEQEKAEVNKLIMASENSKKKWNALFQHWEDDRRQARNQKIDMRDVLGQDNNNISGDDLNTFTFGRSSVSIAQTTSSKDSSVLDYTSTSSLFSNKESYDFEALFGVQWIVGPVGGGSFEYTSKTKIIDSTSASISRSRKILANFVETDEGDKMCVELYESPHSGTFVFEICGGETRCPHVIGTDAREKLRLNVIESPTGMLEHDTGRIVLEIDTFDMAESLDALDVILELDASTALFPVRFDIGSASLNQPLEFSVDRKRTEVYIMFERLDPNLKSIQIVGSVRSKCDSSVNGQFSFHVEWSSQCPPVNWGGELKEMDGKIQITTEKRDLSVTAVNPTGTHWRDYDDITVEVSLWYREYDSITEPWKKVPDSALRALRDRTSSFVSFVDKEDLFGSSTLWLSADSNSLFRSGVRYEFELRSQCNSVLANGSYQQIGETRSGTRLGIVDLKGPRLISWAITQNLNVPTLGFPVCKVIFDEAIDCSHPALHAIIKSKADNRSFEGGVYCTGLLQQLNIVLQLDSEEKIAFWSEADIEVDIFGVRDIHGNLYGVEGNISSERQLSPCFNSTADCKHITMNFTAPSIPVPNQSGPISKWVMPTKEEVISLVEEERNRILPRHASLASSHSYQETRLDGSTSMAVLIGSVLSFTLLLLLFGLVWDKLKKDHRPESNMNKVQTATGLIPIC
mmetsp:Transcript_9072/g.13923  ORF Transcript_9072/g.13923 Transcript_9072/m.13923 type:complete len:859 (-) Transcript_9072:114-2690(-)